MAAPVKSPVREAIEAEVLAALRTSARPLTSREFLIRCESAQDKAELARILYRMREAGTIEPGPEVAPGQPGGRTGKSARACLSYRLPTCDPVQLEGVETVETESALLDTAGSSSNGDEYAHPPIESEQEAADAVSPWLRSARAERERPECSTEDRGEPSDVFGRSEADLWAFDVLQLRDSARDALVEIADQLLAEHPVYAAIRAVDRRAQQLASDYV